MYPLQFSSVLITGHIVSESSATKRYQGRCIVYEYYSIRLDFVPLPVASTILLCNVYCARGATTSPYVDIRVDRRQWQHNTALHYTNIMPFESKSNILSIRMYSLDQHLGCCEQQLWKMCVCVCLRWWSR